MMRSGGPRATTVHTARRIKNWWGGEPPRRRGAGTRNGSASAAAGSVRRRRAAVEALKPLPKKFPREQQ